MITEEPMRPGVHRFWGDPADAETKETAVVLVMVRREAGVLYASQFYPKPEGGAVEVLASEMRGRWEFVPETPLERQVFRRRK